MKTAFLVAAVAILSVASADNDSFDKRCLRACPYDFRPICASNGQNYRVFSNKCTLEAENCNAGYKRQHLWIESPLRMCGDVYSPASPHPIACPKIYIPVCGFDGITYKIFNNPCLLRGQQYTDGHKWTQTLMELCKYQTLQADLDLNNKCMKACTFDYRPVCGFDGVNYVTFGNPCDMEVQNCLSHNRWSTFRMGECVASYIN